MTRHRSRTQATHIDADSRQQQTEPVTTTIVAETSGVTLDPQKAPAGESAMPVLPSKAPTTKLALIISRIGQPAGATIGELIAATNWQAHTIRAAISRLRQNKHAITLVSDPSGRKAYRLVEAEG